MKHGRLHDSVVHSQVTRPRIRQQQQAAFPQAPAGQIPYHCVPANDQIGQYSTATIECLGDGWLGPIDRALKLMSVGSFWHI